VTMWVLYMIFVRLTGWMALLACGGVEGCRAAGGPGNKSSADSYTNANNRGTHPGAISCRPIPPRPHTRTVRHCPKIVPS
jgi:hypothetical protein